MALCFFVGPNIPSPCGLMLSFNVCPTHALPYLLIGVFSVQIQTLCFPHLSTKASMPRLPSSPWHVFYYSVGLRGTVNLPPNALRLAEVSGPNKKAPSTTV